MREKCPVTTISRHHSFLWVVVLAASAVALIPFLLVHTGRVFPSTELGEVSRETTRGKPLAGKKLAESLQSSRNHFTSTISHSALKYGRVTASHEDIVGDSTLSGTEKCAICFFGLPRSFKLLVLPSIVKNVLIPNVGNNCDIFMHYYHVEQETGGRSGHGGTLNPNDVYLLPQELRRVSTQYSNFTKQFQPHISIINDTEQDFWKKRGEQLTKYRQTKGPDGKYLYFPWMAKSFTYPTSIDNIVKQWHSIDSVFHTMVRTGQTLNRNYTRVAMLRNDVVYVTPFDIYKTDCSSSYDRENRYAVVPNWARFPINDRMIYGPFAAVQVWATERFSRLEDHVLTYEPGYGMHSERFLNHSIFPAIRNLGIPVIANPDICFFRARADGSMWSNDCATRDGAARGFRNKKDTKQLVEAIVGRSCQESKLSPRVTQLQCNDGA